MKRLFNNDWYFSKHPLDTSLDDINSPDTVWAPVDIPHDWLIYNTKDLYENSIGCYRKTFTVESLTGKRISLLFEGVYMNTTLYVVGHKGKGHTRQRKHVHRAQHIKHRLHQ